MLGVQETPYVGRFARDWHRLATTDPSTTTASVGEEFHYPVVVSLASRVLALVLIVVCFGGAVLDFRHHETAVSAMERFGMPKNFEVVAGVVKVFAGLGLLTGLFVDGGRGPLTTTTALCLTAYFLIATALHLRARDQARNVLPAAVLALSSLVLALVTL